MKNKNQEKKRKIKEDFFHERGYTLIYIYISPSYIFENLCVRDLRVYANVLDGDVYHYRDKTGLECDAVIHLRNGKYGLIEVKLGGDDLINEGAASLLKLSDRIDTTKMSKPSFMMVLCGIAPFAYRREDGVFVVPISCLKD